ncbi:MAG: XdhC family protein [Phycisphaerales bacterium]|nr:MAG: XdhC family protein [Phycisphaerales bacterium]
MSELLPVLRDMICEADAGRPSALCVVVQTSGSTPRRPGAAMLLRADLTALGTVGGGYVEADVKRRASEVLQQRGTAVLDFSLDRDLGRGDGPICGGRMSVGVTTVTPDADLEPYRRAVESLQRRERAWFPIVVEQKGKRLEYRVHLEVPPTLLIAGAGHVGQAVARLAGALDFHVVVIDDRADCAARERFGSDVKLIVDDIGSALRSYPIDSACFVVIVTRGHQHDYQALDAVVRSPAHYVGMIASKRKAQMIFGRLAASGVPPELIDRVHSPIGLPIGAATVPELAVSIVAELVQARRRDTPKLVEGPTQSTTDG